MPTGVSPIYYPEQTAPPLELELDNSYLLVRLHDAQAFFEAGWLVQPSFLIFSSSVESSFQLASPTQSLHQVKIIQKNTPCRLGIATNLTDWLPFRATDSLKVTLKFIVVQDQPFGELVDQMGKVGLAAKLSLVRPDWAVAVKVSEIVGRLLSYCLREGKQHEVFSLVMDLNMARLKPGYHAVIGSQSNQSWPAALAVDANGRLSDKVGLPLQTLSYAVVEVLALKRRGEESARGEPWWELLQTAKDQALNAASADTQEQRQAFSQWRSTLSQIRALARKESGYLVKEIQEIVGVAHVEVEGALAPITRVEAAGLEELPQDLQELLGVRSDDGLRQSVRDYQTALSISRQLIKRYQLAEG